MSFSRLLSRIIMVPFGLFVAILAAGLFLSFSLLAMEPVASGEPVLENMFAIFSGLAIAGLFGSVAFYPALLGLMLTELFSWRSLWIYLAFGLAVSLFGLRSPAEPADAVAMGLDVRAMGAGLIAGFVYWLIAGRGAGIVKRTLTNKPRNL